MCEYSLEAVRSEKARIGESYDLVRANGHTSFVTDKSCTTAACMPEGARLRLSGIHPDVQKCLGIAETEEVIMVRIPYELVRNEFYDGVRFKNGQEKRIAYLCHTPKRDGSPGWDFHPGVTGTVLMTALKDAPEDADLAGPPRPEVRLEENVLFTAVSARASIASILNHWLLPADRVDGDD